MSSYNKEYFNDDHEKKDHRDCGLQYIVHKLERPVLEFKSAELTGQVVYDPDTTVFTVTGRFHGLSNVGITYWAANPIGRGYSYSGSGLPFANPEMAYENTPNQGDLLLDNSGQFQIQLDHPNSYYVGQGSVLLKPHVHLGANGKVYTVQLGDNLPYRSLKNLPGRPNRTQPGPLGGTGGR
jgi:hypothetical protein